MYTSSTHPVGREVDSNDFATKVLPLLLLSILVDKLALDEFGEGLRCPRELLSFPILHHNGAPVSSDQTSILSIDKHQGWDSRHLKLAGEVALQVRSYSGINMDKHWSCLQVASQNYSTCSCARKTNQYMYPYTYMCRRGANIN